MQLWESFVSVSIRLMFTPGQCRAARGLLGWSQQELAQQAGVGVVTVHQLEASLSQPRRATLDVIQRAFEAAGIEFTNGNRPGVRLSNVIVNEGRALTQAPKRASTKSRRAKSAKP
jgi:transcriptional regulator with XRE-family HTH domain